MLARILLGVAVLQTVSPAPAITGRVVTPDGAPVTQGTVAVIASDRVTAAIDRNGNFRLSPVGSAPQQLFISVPGYAPYRAIVALPAARQVALPDITLIEATYFHVRFTTGDGEPLAASGLRRRSIDGNGLSIADPLGHVREQSDPDGLLIGPLPLGRTLMAFDRVPYAQTRLRDVNVTGKDRVIEGGTIVIERGAQFHVDAVDAEGRAVPRLDVWLEEAARPSLLNFPTVRTNEQGRATFDRLAPGRYRLFTQTPERCGNTRLIVSRLITTGGTESSRARVVVDGRVAIRITSKLGPMLGRTVSAAPDAPVETPFGPRWSEMAAQAGRPLPIRSTPAGCGGVTDHDGRIALAPFPPGPAVVRVQLFNSTYIVRVNVPEVSSEMVIAVPEGLVPVRVTNRQNSNAVAAQLTWSGGGGRVEANTTPNGDALVEGVGVTGGTLTVAAGGYQTLEGGFSETPDTLQEVALAPAPQDRLTVRVTGESGEVIADAVVQLLPRVPGDAPEFAVVDAKGVATFSSVPAGTIRFSAHAEGFKPALISVPEENRAAIAITLTRVP